MIVVIGRPGLDERGQLAEASGHIAAAAATAGAKVELVGSIPDTNDGDATATALGRAGVGHAALLRVPTDAAPRLDAADIELALRYLTDCRVVVVAETLGGEALAAAVDGAEYHRAAVVVITGGQLPTDLSVPDNATLLEAPLEHESAFTDMVGCYAAELDGGRSAEQAWTAALAATGWESSAT